MAYQETEAQRICVRYDRLKGERATFESTWQEIAEVIRPIRAEFTTKRSAGEKRHAKIFDSTPLMAADNFAGGIYGMMTSPSNRWFSLKLDGDDADLADWGPVKDWLYSTTTIILNSFGPEYSRFYNVIPSLYADLACFGNAIFYSEEQVGSRRINDTVRALSECVFAENQYGEIDTLYRRYSEDARNVVDMFPETVSDKVKKIADKTPYEKVWLIHCVEEDAEYEPDRLGKFPYKSIYIEQESKTILSRKGYWEMPYQVPRWSQAAGETYGRGLGEIVIADVKTLNQQSRTSLVTAQKAADPPLLAPDEGVIRQARTFPGGITYGAIDSNGNQLIRPLIGGSDTRLTLEMMEQRRQSIREGFYFSLMQMVGSPDMTATEWIGRQEEKLRLLGPNLGRIQSEFLSPLVSRRFGMLNRMMQIPPAPEELQGKKVSVDYVSPLARAQMAGEAQAVVRLYQSIEPIAGIDPTILDNINHDEALSMLAKGWAVPAPVMRAQTEVQQIRADRQQQQQMAQMAQMAQMGGAAFKNVAQGGKEMAAAENQRAQAEQAGATPQKGGGDMGAAIQMLRKALSGGRAA